MVFSVLIPVYNVEKYLQKCIESVLRQTEKDFELLLLDDGSSDNSGAICDTYAAKYPDKIRAFHSTVNEGQLLSRRKLFEKAQGEWIVCVDSDDYIAENALERIRNAFETFNVDMVMYNLICFHMDGYREVFRPSLKNQFVYTKEHVVAIYEALTKNKYLNSLCTKAFKRELIDAGIDYSPWRGLKIGEDLFQSYPLWDNCKNVVYIDETLYYYRKNENSITAQLPLDFYRGRTMLWERDDYYANKWHVDEDTIDIVYRQRISDIMDYIRTVSVLKLTPEVISLIKEISNDGLLAKYITNTTQKIQPRDMLIYIFVKKKRVRALHVFCQVESRLKRLLKKDSIHRNVK